MSKVLIIVMTIMCFVCMISVWLDPQDSGVFSKVAIGLSLTLIIALCLFIQLICLITWSMLKALKLNQDTDDKAAFEAMQSELLAQVDKTLKWLIIFDVLFFGVILTLYFTITWTVYDGLLFPRMFEWMLFGYLLLFLICNLVELILTHRWFQASELRSRILEFQYVLVGQATLTVVLQILGIVLISKNNGLLVYQLTYDFGPIFLIVIPVGYVVRKQTKRSAENLAEFNKDCKQQRSGESMEEEGGLSVQEREEHDKVYATGNSNKEATRERLLTLSKNHLLDSG